MRNAALASLSLLFSCFSISNHFYALTLFCQNWIRLVFALTIFLSVLPAGKAQDTMKVLVTGNPPFVMEDSLSPSGISVDVWESLALHHQLEYRYLWNTNVDEALKMVEDSLVDVLVGPISITSDRAEKVRFSQPYFLSSLSIVSSKRGLSIWQRIKPFFSRSFFVAVSIFLLVLASVGTLIWLAERKGNPEEFPADPIQGIGNGLWLALVTMTTVGYGDRAPVTAWGRVIVGVWMVIALLTATSLIAGIASTLTVSGMSSSVIHGAEDLSGKKVAVVGVSPAIEFVEEHDGQIVRTISLESAFEQLQNHEVDALVYDRPQLQYFMENHKSKTRDLVLGIGEYLPQGYGFATPLNSSFGKILSVYLLEMQEVGEIKSIVDSWLKDTK